LPGKPYRHLRHSSQPSRLGQVTSPRSRVGPALPNGDVASTDPTQLLALTVGSGSRREQQICRSSWP
jgi:hypothetical protein